MNYILHFENFLLQSHGTHFQDLFCKVMKRYYEDFVPVKEYGPNGDKGCDGYNSNYGIYYQVYGAENKTGTLDKAMKKLKKDFENLYTYINSQNLLPIMRGYRFVINSKRSTNIPLQLAESLKELGVRFPQIKFEIWDIDTLLDIFSQMEKYLQENILGIHISQDLTAEEFINNIRLKELQQDSLSMHHIQNRIFIMKRILEDNDFIAPFSINCLDEVKVFIDMLQNTLFYDEEIKEVQDNCYSYFVELYNLILFYSRVTGNPTMLRLARIEPWGEIRDEDFDDVRNKILYARNKAYNQLIYFFVQYDELKAKLHV